MSTEIMDRYRRERADLGIGPLIFGEIRGAIERLAQRRPVAELFPGRDRWSSDLLEELTHDFVIHLLQGRLSESFSIARDTNHFRMLLRLYARQFVSNRLRGTESDNVRRRAVHILNGDPRFDAVAFAGRRHWLLRGSKHLAFDGSDADLRRIAMQTPLGEVRGKRDTLIASAVLLNEDLGALLENLLRLARAALDERSIRVALDERLGLRPVQTFSTEAVGEALLEADIGIAGHPADRLVVEEAAEDVIAVLTIRQLRIFGRRFARQESRDSIAAALGIGHGTVDAELRRIGAVIVAACEGSEPLARAVLRLLTDHYMRWTSP